MLVCRFIGNNKSNKIKIFDGSEKNNFFYLNFLNDSFDVRGKSMSDATEWSDATVFGTRAKFITQSEPAFLEIDVS